MAETKKQQAKIGKVMHEFKAGSLKSGKGGKVTTRKQAVAIALSEAGASAKQTGKTRAGSKKPGTRKKAA